MLYRLRTKLQRARHDRAIAGILTTAPIRPTSDRVVFASMVCHADVLMYLIAIKSVFARIGKGRVVCIDDGSLTSDDLRILAYHLAEPRIIHINDVACDVTPRGGTWERLLTCIDLSRADYVIQVDADIVTLGAMDEVTDAIAMNAPFTLGTPGAETFMSMDAAARLAQSYTGEHTQLVAERAFAQMPDAATLRYLRGSSAFTGFAIGGIDRGFAEGFSQQMQKLLGERWQHWGTEQVTSNAAIANSPGARVLPIARYAGYAPPIDPNTLALVHFVGTHRFGAGHYTRLSHQVIEHLLAARPS